MKKKQIRSMVCDGLELIVRSLKISKLGAKTKRRLKKVSEKIAAQLKTEIKKNNAEKSNRKIKPVKANSRKRLLKKNGIKITKKQSSLAN